MFKVSCLFARAGSLLGLIVYLSAISISYAVEEVLTLDEAGISPIKQERIHKMMGRVPDGKRTTILVSFDKMPPLFKVFASGNEPYNNGTRVLDSVGGDKAAVEKTAASKLLSGDKDFIVDRINMCSLLKYTKPSFNDLIQACTELSSA